MGKGVAHPTESHNLARLFASVGEKHYFYLGI